MTQFEMKYEARFTNAATSRFKVLASWVTLHEEEGYAGAVLTATEWNNIMRLHNFYLLKSWTALGLMDVAGQEEYTYTKDTNEGPVEAIGTRRLYKLADNIPTDNYLLRQVFTEAGMKPTGDIWENGGAGWRSATDEILECRLHQAERAYEEAKASAYEAHERRNERYEAIGEVLNAARPFIDWSGIDK